MSTPAERAFNAARCIMPVEISVKQHDGTRRTQVVDASVRELPSKNAIKRRIEDEEACREVRRALNEWYYGGDQ